MLRALTPWRERPLMRERFPQSISRLEEEMEELMERLFGEPAAVAGMVAPSVNVAETATEFEVTAELPGLNPEEVSVELRNGELWISGRHEEEKEEQEKTFHRVERRHGEFRRVLPLPVAVTAEAIEATFENGVLTVRIPKPEEAVAERIQVRTERKA